MISILTEQEIIELTGRIQQRKQCEWLRNNGFRFMIGADRRPKVDRSHYLEMMGCVSSEKTYSPNFGAIKKSA